MTLKGSFQAIPGQHSPCFSFEKPHDWRCLGAGPICRLALEQRRSPWQRAAGAPCSRFAFYLQKLLGTPAPVLVCLQAAAQKVSQESGLLPGVLQLWGVPGAYQLSNLEKKATPHSTCLLRAPNRSPTAHWASSTLQGHFPPCPRVADAFAIPTNRTRSQGQPQPVQRAKAPALSPGYIG